MRGLPESLQQDVVDQIAAAYQNAEDGWTGCDWATDHGTSQLDLSGWSSEDLRAAVDHWHETGDDSRLPVSVADHDVDDVAEDLDSAIEWLEVVESAAAAAQAEAAEAVQAAERLDLDGAYAKAEAACKSEEEYGDCPNWRAFRDLIDLFRRRVETAKGLGTDLGLQVQVIGQRGQWVVVDDGADRWLAERSDYEQAIVTVLDRILGGAWDRRYEEDIEILAYDALCYACDCLYSRIGSPSDISIVGRLAASPRERADLLDALRAEPWEAYSDLATEQEYDKWIATGEPVEWLVFADWLEEQGDPRADAVRERWGAQHTDLRDADLHDADLGG